MVSRWPFAGGTVQPPTPQPARRRSNGPREGCAKERRRGHRTTPRRVGLRLHCAQCSSRPLLRHGRVAPSEQGQLARVGWACFGTTISPSRGATLSPTPAHHHSVIRQRTKLHERATVGGEQHTHPVERVGRLVGLGAVDRDLAADQEDEERDRRPQDLLLRRNTEAGRRRRHSATVWLTAAVPGATLRRGGASSSPAGVARRGRQLRLPTSERALGSASVSAQPLAQTTLCRRRSGRNDAARTLKGILRSGGATSGRMCSTGLISVKNRNFPNDAIFGAASSWNSGLRR